MSKSKKRYNRLPITVSTSRIDRKSGLRLLGATLCVSGLVDVFRLDDAPERAWFTIDTRYRHGAVRVLVVAMPRHSDSYGIVAIGECETTGFLIVDDIMWIRRKRLRHLLGNDLRLIDMDTLNTLVGSLSRLGRAGDSQAERRAWYRRLPGYWITCEYEPSNTATA